MACEYVMVYQEWDLIYPPRVDDSPEENIIPPTKQHHSFRMVVQKARIRMRMTVQDVANKLNVPSLYITQIESGIETPLPAFSNELLRVLNVSD